MIHPVGHDGVHFTPVPVHTTLPDAATQPWPMGDAPSASRGRPNLDRAKMQAAVDLAFADPAGLTAAMVVVHKGQIVGERYMAGITKDTQLESWSMGKSLTATLVGLGSRTARSRSTIRRRCPSGGGPAIRAAPSACAT